MQIEHVFYLYIYNTYIDYIYKTLAVNMSYVCDPSTKDI